MHSYRTIEAPAFAEYVEKRSRFLAQAVPVCTAEEALAVIEAAKTKYWDASHNCSAYILRSGGTQRYSDDGEPQGTAGVPMLEVLRRESFTDLAVVVTRYFGGTLLGAGGLVRAYSHSTKLVLQSANPIEMRMCNVFSLEMDYNGYGRIEALLGAFGASVLDTSFGEKAALTARMETENWHRFVKELAEQTAGRIQADILRQEYAAFPVL